MTGEGATKKSKASSADTDEAIDGDLLLSVQKLQDLQDELEKVNDEVTDKVVEIEQKYNELRRPVYEKRGEIIKSIPGFWSTAFVSHPTLGDLLNEEDQKMFKYLDSLEVEDSKDVKSGFSITFNFKTNPHFEDAKLTKTFTFLEEGTTKITGTKIKWKEGMFAAGVTHEKNGKKRPLVEESFFSWFSENQQKEIAEGLHDEVAEIIKEDLWPNPLKYFNNEADEEDSDEDDDDDEVNIDVIYSPPLENGDDDEEDDS